jgi:lipopolysaccharide heptosyltransferase II
MMKTHNWCQAEKVLCDRLDTLGDVLMTTPAIRAQREARPGRRTALLTSPSGAAVAALVPEIDEVLVYDAPWMKATAPRPDSRRDYAMVERLRAAHFDAAVIFTVYSQNPLPAALVCYLADIPLRLAHCHENPYQLLTDWVPDPEPASGVRHEVRRQLDLVAAVGCRCENVRMSLRVSDGTRLHVLRQLYQLGVEFDRPWVLIHPGATAPSRRYPPDRFATVAQALVQRHDCQIVFTGTGPEGALVEHIRALMRAPSHSVVGWFDLEHLAALIALAPVLVSNNTGPVHIAASQGTPVVDLYALTNPQHTPWEVPHRVLFHDVPCKYCYKSVCPQEHHNCLRLVPPEAVVAATCELLGQRSMPAARLSHNSAA